MNFGEFLDSSSQQGGGSGSSRIVTNNFSYSNYNNMSSSSIAHHSLATSPMFNSPGLSLALQTGMEGQGEEIARMGDSYENNLNVITNNNNNNNNINNNNNNNNNNDNIIINNNNNNNTNNNNGNGVSVRRSRDDEHGSRSGSGDGSGDDHDDNPRRRKKYHRHTAQQIQELETLFKVCPHPDEKQRAELSRRLGLDNRQVKFWFQNRRTQLKTQLERKENSLLRQENEKLHYENMSMSESVRNPICTDCAPPATMGDISIEEQELTSENARLREEHGRVRALIEKILGRPISSFESIESFLSAMGPPMPNPSLELGVGSNGFAALNSLPSSLSLGASDFGEGSSSSLPVMSQNRGGAIESSMYSDLALAAMHELFNLAQAGEPLWIRTSEGGKEFLNYDQYMGTFTPCIGMKPNGFVSEASRESGTVIINSLALVETLMDSSKWADMFPCMVAKASTTDVISTGWGGTRNGALQLIQAEFQVLSPLVPVREVTFLRFCKQQAEDVWAVVDVSVKEGASQCRRLPSGCIVQQLPNGYSKVTWIEHAEYDESQIQHLYRPLISDGMGFGAQRWVAALQRQCECRAILLSPPPPRDQTATVTPAGRLSMVRLAQRMTDSYAAGVTASSVHKWNILNNTPGSVDKDMRVMTRNSMDIAGEPAGIVLSAATSVWLPVSCQRVFDFLRDERLRSEWDILSIGGPMHEIAHITKGQAPGNCVSVLRVNQPINPTQGGMLILQETRIDIAGAVVVYAPVDIPAMRMVMSGGESAYVALLPSGFSIVPDGPNSYGPNSNGDPSNQLCGSLLTIAFQILVNSVPTAKLTVESVETVNKLISCTAQRIKSSLGCEG